MCMSWSGPGVAESGVRAPAPATDAEPLQSYKTVDALFLSASIYRRHLEGSTHVFSTDNLVVFSVQ